MLKVAWKRIFRRVALIFMQRFPRSSLRKTPQGMRQARGREAMHLAVFSLSGL